MLPKVEIQFGYKEARTRLKNAGLPVLSLVNPENLQTLLLGLYDDDLIFQEMAYQYKKQHNISEEELLDRVDQSDIEAFREQFWEAVVAFTNHRLREFLIHARQKLEETFRNPNSMEQSYDSMQEQE